MIHEDFIFILEILGGIRGEIAGVSRNVPSGKS
jgi:hypothetical protein